jgi:hypothetical protein
VILQFEELSEELTTPQLKKIEPAIYEMLQSASEIFAISCKHGNETLGFIKGREIIDSLSRRTLLL